MPAELKKNLQKCFSAEEIIKRESRIIDEVASRSANLKTHRFSALNPLDLEILFDAIDQAFLDGTLTAGVAATRNPLAFRLANRMTHTGGTTTARLARKTGHRDFTIAIAPRVIFETFETIDSAIICGIPCRSMRMALIRIMQHEMIHLAEFLVTGNSSCNKPPFKKVAKELFGHTETRHRMLTPGERSRLTHQLGPGDKVQFSFDNQLRNGVINRINRRATVLVENEAGKRYSNGKRYDKYYVPLNQLRPVADKTSD